MSVFTIGNSTITTTFNVPAFTIIAMRNELARNPFEVVTFEDDAIVAWWEGSRRSCDVWVADIIAANEYPCVNVWHIRERTAYDVMLTFGYGYDISMGYVTIR